MINPSPNNGRDCPVRYVPRPDYVREMIRYGILPADLDPGRPYDFRAAERAYWRSFWYDTEQRGNGP